MAAAHRPGALLAPIVETVLLQSLLDALRAQVAGEPEDAAHEVEVLLHGQVFPQREALRHVTDLHAQPLGVLRYRVPEHRALAIARAQQAAQHADRGRFAGAVRAEKAVDRRARNVEADVIDSRELAEATREVARADGRTVSRAGVHLPLSGSVTCTGMPVGTFAAAG